MTAFNFPNSPAINEVYQYYTWDGEKWILTLGGVPMPANPATLVTGILGWWDASVTASLTLSGTGVTSIADQSGAARTANYVNTRPEYSATALNTSYPGMVFDTASPSNRALQVSSFPMGTGTSMTVWWVGTLAHAASSPGNNRVLSYIQAAGSDDATEAGSFCIIALSSKTSTTLQRNYTYFQTSPAVAISPAAHRFIYTISSGGVATIYIDGYVRATGSLPGTWGNNGTLALGRKANNNSDYGLNIIGELGVATGFTNATNVALLDTYLRNKWGMPLSWQTAWTMSFSSNQNGIGGMNIRQVIAASELVFGGSKVRVTLYSSFAAPGTLVRAAIGHSALSGDTYDFDGNQAQLMFSGSAGITIPANTGVTSDELVFTVDKTKNLVIAMYFSSGSTRIVNAAGTTRAWTKVVADEVMTTNVSTYDDYGYNWVVGSVEVYT